MTQQDLITALEDNQRLRHERDEAIKQRDAARREVCYCHPESAQFAINRDWDCFNTDHIGEPNDMEPVRTASSMLCNELAEKHKEENTC